MSHQDEKKENEEKNDFDNLDLENLTEEELDKLLNEQAKLCETLENLNKNSDMALKIFQDLQKLPNEEEYDEKAAGIQQALNELGEKIKPLQDKT